MPTVTLICAYDGHTWERESQRGRRPLYCPEHSDSPVSTGEEVPSPGQSEVPSQRAIDTLLAQAYVALDKTGRNDEDCRKVRYCARQIESGRTDLDCIEACLKDICRKASRS